MKGAGTYDACPWELTDEDEVDRARSQIRLKVFLILVLVESLMNSIACNESIETVISLSLAFQMIHFCFSRER